MMLLISSCQNDSEYYKMINYEELNLINVSIGMEIGEEDEFIFGDLIDLTVLPDGEILVADWGNITVEQFNADGKHMATIAREGRGPGELLDYFTLEKGHNDTLLVRYLDMSQQIDFFSQGDDGIYKYIQSWVPEKLKVRTMITLGSRSETEYYAREYWNNHQVRSMIVDRREYGYLPVTIVDVFENVLVDSLHMLKTSITVAKMSQGGALTILGRPPYQFSDQFSVMKNGGYVIASPDSSALFIYNSVHELEKRILLNVMQRPIKRTDLDFWFELSNTSEYDRRELEPHVPDMKPVFLNIWAIDNYFWLYVDKNAKGKKFVVLNMQGDPIGSFYLSVYDQIQHIRNNKIYTLYKNPDLGHTIRIYEIDF